MYALCRGQVLVAKLDLLYDLLGQLAKGSPRDAVSIQRHRFAIVATFANTADDRNLAQQWNLQLFCETFATFLAK